MLLAGATGLVGREVLKELLRREWEVVALARRPSPHEVPAGVIQITADVLGGSWQRWCEGCSAVINLIGTQTELPREGITFDRNNRQAAESIVASASGLGVQRTIHVSALAPAQVPPTSLQRSKLDGEQAVLDSGLVTTILRPTVIFGPGDHFATPLASALRRAMALPIPGDGETLFQPVAVQEVAEAVAACLDGPASEGMIIELGGPERLTFNEVVRRTARSIGLRRTLLHVPLGLSRFLVSLAEKLPDPPVTAAGLAAVLAGATCDTTLASATFGSPQRRFEGAPWLAKGHGPAEAE